KNGSHIHGLDKDYFRILENGKQQKIVTFEEVVASNAKIPASATIPGEYSNVTIAGKEPRPITVIVIDTVNTPFLDQARGRLALIKYLADNIDADQVLALMVMTSDGVRVVQGLSGDSERLVQILKKVTGGLPENQGTSLENQANAALGTIPVIPQITPTSEVVASLAGIQAIADYSDTMAAQFQQTRAIEATLKSFLDIAWTLSGVPGRKSILWLTSGFPFVISSPDVLPPILAPLYERTIQAFAENHISVYPVDVRGIMTLGEGEAAPTAVVNPSGAPSRRQLNNRTWLLYDTYQTLDELAGMTGGKAFYNTNDLTGSFKRAAEDSSAYYLVGYYLDTKNNHAGWRKLKVEVDKKDVQVRAREGFFVTNATVNPDTTRVSELTNALASPLEGTGVPMILKWTGITEEGNKKKAAFSVWIPPAGLTLQGSQQLHVNFDVAIAAYRSNSKDGKPVLTTGQTVNTAVSPPQVATIRANGITFTKNFEISSGQYAVRVVIRDGATGNLGSVTAPLTVN
ncbi:MAG TPA: VWA domain-containing protein, partial [Terriglobales bacterium]|nr:VWA domain-containing protein [Terriglobales bacterium]